MYYSGITHRHILLGKNRVQAVIAININKKCILFLIMGLLEWRNRLNFLYLRLIYIFYISFLTQ